MNECKIELFIDVKGHFTYNVTITKFDIIGNLYAFEGNLFSFEEAKEREIALNKLKSPFSFQIKRDKVYSNIIHKNIRNFLYDNTGSANQEKLNILYKLYSKGKKEPQIKFKF
jgi:hypothetical protein